MPRPTSVVKAPLLTRILVTGAAGFIGSPVSRYLLARGDTVLGIDSLSDYYDVTLKHARLAEPTKNDGGSSFKQVDFSDHVALAAEEFDRMVHLGVQTDVRDSIKNPIAYLKANIVGHLTMLEIGRNRRIEYLVYTSSSSVYGGNDTLSFRVEDRAGQPCHSMQPPRRRTS